MSQLRTGSSRLRAQRGFTMPELMVALLIGLFLIGGLLIIVQDNRRTFSSQNQLAQLQDAERLGMTMMTDVIQAAGYYPNPVANVPAALMPAAGVMIAGQAMTGTFNAAAPGDTITVRYATANADGILNCSGGSNNTGATQAYTNVFSVIVNAQGISQLVCALTVGGVVTNYPLVNNVTQIALLYGVNTVGAGNNVDTYMNAAQVTAANDWNNVVSVQITLTFANPLFSAVNQGQGNQPQTVTFQRVVGVMAKTGI